MSYRQMAVVFMLLLAGCGQKDVDPNPENGEELPDGTAVRLVVEPSSAMLEPNGTLDFRVRAFDADDLEVKPPSFEIAVADEVVADVADLRLSGLALGTTHLVATAADLEPAEMFVAVVDIADGVKTFRDDQVIRGPDRAELIDDVLRYKVVVRESVGAEAGDLVLSMESAPVMGRVVATAADASDVELTVDLVPLDEIFDALEVHEQGEVGPQHITVAERAAEHFEVSLDDDGTYVFTPKAPGSALNPSALAWVWGAFECSAEIDFPYGDVGAVSPRVNQSLRFNLDYSRGDLRRFSIDGESTVSLKMNPKLTAAVEGKATCDAELLRIQFPIGGPLSLVFGAGVPLGVGFEIGGKITVANFEMDFDGRVGATAEVGIGCLDGGDCAPILEVAPIADADAKFVLPDNSQTRVEPAVSVYGLTGLVVGPSFLSQLKMELLRAQGGPVFAGNLSAFRFQAEDAAYASSYDLKLAGKVGLGSALEWLGKLLKREIGTNELDAETVLSQSPSGSYSVPDTWINGQAVDVTVDLSNVRFLSFENVEGVELWDVSAGRTPQMLARTDRSSEGQTQYTLSYTPDVVLNGGSETRTIAVGVDTVVGGGILLEVDTARTITLREAGMCDGVAFTITPSLATVRLFTPTPMATNFTTPAAATWNSPWSTGSASSSLTIDLADPEGVSEFGQPITKYQIVAECASDESVTAQAELIVEAPDWVSGCSDADGVSTGTGPFVGALTVKSAPADFVDCGIGTAPAGDYEFAGTVVQQADGSWQPRVSLAMNYATLFLSGSDDFQSWGQMSLTADSTFSNDGGDTLEISVLSGVLTGTASDGRACMSGASSFEFDLEMGPHQCVAD